jgi:deoxyribodipyrimidine photo-lyase
MTILYFNPVSQSDKFASPEYLRYWLPELQNVPDKNIHAPWEMQNAPKAYPKPIVDHAEARQRSLNVFKKARGEK